MGYSTGTVSVTSSSATVTGSGTAFIDNTRNFDQFRGPDGKIYEIIARPSDTTLTIAPSYEGSTASGQSYLIMQTGSGVRDLADRTSLLYQDFADVRDQAGAGMFGDGTVSVPGIRFLADQDTGWRRTGTNAMAAVVGGADTLTLSSTGLVAGGSLHKLSGDLAVNYSGTPGVNVIAKNVANNAGAAVFVVQGIASGIGQTITGVFCAVTGTGYSATATAMALNKDTGTGKSLNLAGTVGASGADPAEAQYKCDGCPTIAKGQVVGVDDADRLTMVYADAIDFGIKTVDPSYVGAERWSRPAHITATYGTPYHGMEPALPENPTTEQTIAHDAAMAAWSATKAAFEAALETERQKIDRISHGGGRLPCIVSGTVVAGQYVIAQDDGDGGVEAVCAATVADADRWRIVGRVRIANPTEAQLRELISADITINPAWSAIVVQMKA